MTDTTDKQALKSWEDFHANMMKSQSIDETESSADKLKRIARLEADHEAWFKYYFESYCKAEPAKFHKRASKRIIENRRHFEQRRWARGLAKSARTMMEFLFLVLAKKKLKTIILTSSSYDDAEKLLTPFKLALELNERIINDYGIQKNPGMWQNGDFTTREGVLFLGVGAGQSPRGTRNEAFRVDGIIIDDFDTDEECRNERIVKEKFKWLQEALLPTVDISGDYIILMNGNLISKNSCVALAAKIASYVDEVNIRDENGRSTWIEKNSEKDIDDMLKLMTYSSAQKEFFNNPITEGTVFKEMTYKSMRPLKEYKFLVCYTDPSFKDSKKNDFKATVLMGRWKDEYHIIKAYVEQTTTSKMIDWYYEIDAWVNDRVPVYYYMESNFIQDSLVREFYNASIDRHKVIPLKGDTRKKPDKFTRIESALEPLNANGKLILNAAEKDNPHMKQLEDQFLHIEPGSSAHDDAPDAVEGAKYILDTKSTVIDQDTLKVLKKKKHTKRF